MQNIQQFSWRKERVDQELTDTMRKAYAAVSEVAEGHSIDMRAAAKARVYIKEDIHL